MKWVKSMAIIEMKQLTKMYGAVRGIEQVDLIVKEGEFFGFIGPNGSGKSTAIRTILGLIQPTSGEAKIFGKSIEKDKIEILRNIGYMPSESTFYTGMRVREILRLSAKLHKKDCTKMANELCERLKLDQNKKVETLSLGNRKKVSIVCALQHEPALYILDEPTSGLDPLIQKEVFKILNERHEKGATIFLSSHVLSEIQNNCQRAAIIREGKIIACDTTANLAGTTAKRVYVKGIFELPLMEGIVNSQVHDDGMEFHFSGDLKQFIQRVAEWPFTDITIAEPSLEEMFLHYYSEGERSE